MGSLLLTSGEKGHRHCLPHSRIMIHQPLGGVKGQASDIQIQAEEILDLKKMLTNIYVKHSSIPGMTFEKMEKAMDRDNYLNPERAMTMGLIDNVILRPKVQGKD
jgi:ATP-dependent Clp protease protease subunit